MVELLRDTGLGSSIMLASIFVVILVLLIERPSNDKLSDNLRDPRDREDAKQPTNNIEASSDSDSAINQ